VKTDPTKGGLYKARGCEACGNTGYAGRTVIYEILTVSPEIKDMISRKATLADVRQQAKQEGFMSMAEIGVEKVRMGLTSYEELSSVTRTEEL